MVIYKVCVVILWLCHHSAYTIANQNSKVIWNVYGGKLILTAGQPACSAL